MLTFSQVKRPRSLVIKSGSFIPHCHLGDLEQVLAESPVNDVPQATELLRAQGSYSRAPGPGPCVTPFYQSGSFGPLGCIV